MVNSFGITAVGKTCGKAFIAVVAFALAGVVCSGCAAQTQPASESQSASASASESQSTSASESQSTSASESASASESQSTSASESGAQSASASEIEQQLPADAISWEEASSHIGETVTVYGQVTEIKTEPEDKGQPTYFDLGVAYPDPSRTTMIIFSEDLEAFPESPEALYAGKTICVTGEVFQHEGVSYIKAASPSQVQVLD